MAATASSPILTYGATASRSADAPLVPLGSLAGLTEGTLVVDYVRGTTVPADTYPGIVRLMAADTNNLVGIYISPTTATQPTLIVRTGGANQVVAITSGDGAVNTVARAAAGFKVNDFAVSRAGNAVVTDTSGTVPSSLDTLGIGIVDAMFGGTQVTRVRLTNRRLPNNTLVALTA